MNIYVHTRTRTYKHTYIHTYTKTNLPTYIQTYRHIDTYMTHTYIHTYIHIFLARVLERLMRGTYIHSFVPPIHADIHTIHPCAANVELYIPHSSNECKTNLEQEHSEPAHRQAHRQNIVNMSCVTASCCTNWGETIRSLRCGILSPEASDSAR